MEDVSALGAALLGISLVGTLLVIGIAYLARQRRDTVVTRRFIGYVLAYSGWMFTAFLIWTSPTLSRALAARTLQYVTSTTTFLFWVLFVVAYTNNEEKLEGWRFRALLGFIGASFAVYLADPFYPVQTASLRLVEFQGLALIGFEPTLVYSLNVVISFLIVFWTLYLLVQFYRSAVPGQRQQAGLVIVAQLAPMAAGVAYYLGGLSLHEFLDPTPLFFFLTVAITAFALFYRDFLDVEPMAANTLFEEMEDPVVVLDSDDSVVKINDTARAIGITMGGSLGTTCPPLAEALSADQDEVRLETTTDEHRTFDLRVSAITDNEGGERGQLLVLRDVTPRKQRKRELEAQNERLDEFASVVSHDLRNPLNVAEGNLTLIKETEDLDRIEDVETSLDRMQLIIDDILTMARAGTAVESVEELSLAALAREAWEQSQTANATLDVRFDDELFVNADRTQTLHVLENLFRNAVDHNEGSLAVTIEPIRSSAGDGIVGFAVEDDGEGIPENEQQEVFERGYTTSTDGTGFGLAIVQDIVDAHGWTVEVVTGSSGGARFEITGVDTVVQASATAD